MKDSEASFEIKDRTRLGYFQSRVFPLEQVIVVVPADPNDPLVYRDFAERFDRIQSQARDDHSIEIGRAGWTLYEIKPYEKRLVAEKYTFSQRFFSRTADVTSEFAGVDDIGLLDQIATRHGLPTITEYFRAVEKMRADANAQANEAHVMITSWTKDLPVKELLSNLIFDRENKQHLLDHYKHGWHYGVHYLDRSDYYQAADTHSLLASLIFHAEEAVAQKQQIRFGYCLREFTPNIDWKSAPR